MCLKACEWKRGVITGKSYPVSATELEGIKLSGYCGLLSLERAGYTGGEEFQRMEGPFCVVGKLEGCAKIKAKSVRRGNSVGSPRGSIKHQNTKTTGYGTEKQDERGVSLK